MTELEKIGLKERFTLAQNDTTPVDILVKLASERIRKIRQAVAKNANTPIEILSELGAEFPEDIIKNPSFQLLLLENPENSFVQLSLARSAMTDEQTLIHLSATGVNEQVRCQSLLNPNTPISILEHFFQQAWDEYWGGYNYKYLDSEGIRHPIIGQHHDSLGSEFNDILSAIIRNPNVPESLLIKIAGVANFRTQQVILENAGTPSSVLEELASVNIYLVNNPQAILNHPNASETTIAVIQVMQYVRGIPNEILEKLADHPSVNVRRCLVHYPDLPLTLLLKLAEDQRVHLSIMQIPCEDLPAIVIERIAEISLSHLLNPNYKLANEGSIVNKIALYWRTPSTVLESLALNLSAELCQRYRGDDYFMLTRSNIARNPNTSTEVLERLSNDPQQEVREVAQAMLKARDSEYISNLTN